MEVHAHAHTPRKKWTHYFWEFLMLFLAVFAGFLAENQREHIVEHQRAKVYAVNLYEELKKDTIGLNDMLKASNAVIAKLDTFCLYSREKVKRKVTIGMLYYYGSFTTLIDFFESNNTTIDQLKGSGNLRIMGNDVSQKISNYSKSLSKLENEYELTKSEFSKIEDLYFKIFDGYVTQELGSGSEFDQTNFEVKRDSVFNLNLLLINDDPKLMKEFTGWLKFETSIYKMQNREHLKPLKQSATELISLLKEEYHLE